MSLIYNISYDLSLVAYPSSFNISTLVSTIARKGDYSISNSNIKLDQTVHVRILVGACEKVTSDLRLG